MQVKMISSMDKMQVADVHHVLDGYPVASHPSTYRTRSKSSLLPAISISR